MVVGNKEKLLEIVSAKPGIPNEKPQRREIPDIPNPFKIPSPSRPIKVPQETVPLKR